MGRVVPHSCDNKGISAPSRRLASWLGLSLVINLTNENNEEITIGEATYELVTFVLVTCAQHFGHYV